MTTKNMSIQESIRFNSRYGAYGKIYSIPDYIQKLKTEGDVLDHGELCIVERYDGIPMEIVHSVYPLLFRWNQTVRLDEDDSYNSYFLYDLSNKQDYPMLFNPIVDRLTPEQLKEMAKETYMCKIMFNDMTRIYLV